MPLGDGPAILQHELILRKAPILTTFKRFAKIASELPLSFFYCSNTRFAKNGVRFGNPQAILASRLICESANRFARIGPSCALESSGLSGTESRIANRTLPRITGLESPEILQREAKQEVESQQSRVAENRFRLAIRIAAYTCLAATLRPDGVFLSFFLGGGGEGVRK